MREPQTPPPVPDYGALPDTSGRPPLDEVVADKLGARFARWAVGLIGTGLLGAAATLGTTYVTIEVKTARDEETHRRLERDISALQDDIGAVQSLEREMSALTSKVDTSARDTQRRLEAIERGLERLQDDGRRRDR